MPFYLSINIVFDEYFSSNQQVSEEDVLIRIEEMLQAMNQFTNYHLNAQIRVGHSQWGDTTQRWQYIQGERVEIEPWQEDTWQFGMEHWSSPFELAVFESYRGLFW